MEPIIVVVIILAAIVWYLPIHFAMKMADKRDRSKGFWGVFAALFGVIPLIFLAFMKKSV